MPLPKINIHMLLHSALDQAVKEDLIKKNPTDGCSAPKPEKKEMKVIQPEQIGNYLQAAAERKGVLLKLRKKPKNI